MTKLEVLQKDKVNAQNSQDLLDDEREQILEVIDKKITLEEKKNAKDAPKPAPKKTVKAAPQTPKVEKPEKPAPVAVSPQEKTQQETPKTTTSSTGVEQCKTIIADFNAAKRAKEAQEVRQKMVKEADTPKAIEEVKKLSDSQILASTKPKVRIDVFSREQLEKLAIKNISVRLANLPQKDKKEIPKDKILSLAVDVYKILDKKIDELLK